MATTVPIADTSVWDAFVQKCKDVGKRTVQVGVFGDLELATIARAHEYGTQRVPARSYLRSTMAERQQDVQTQMTRLTAAYAAGKITLDRMLQLLGLFGASAVKAKIRSNIPPPLSPRTIARKGSSLALVDTGRLINSITFKVVE